VARPESAEGSAAAACPDVSRCFGCTWDSRLDAMEDATRQMQLV